MQLVSEAQQWLQAAWFQVANWNWLLIMSVVGVAAIGFAACSAMLAYRRGRALEKVLDAKVDREAENLKKELRRRLSEPPQLFEDHLNGAPTLGARQAFERDIAAAAASVLREAGGERRKARAILRERVRREGSEGSGVLNGTEASYWRQIGALALVDGSLDAVAAYRRAADLAPDDPESQHLVGVLHLRSGNLSAAESAFRRQIELAPGSAKTTVRYRGRTMLGDVCAARHGVDEALDAYLEAKSEIEELLLTSPADPALARDLSFTLDRIGDVHTTKGDYDAAFESYGAALSIAESLARTNGSGNPEYLHDLSVSYERIGDLLDRRGDLAGALQHFNKSLAISKVLVRGNPDNVPWAWDLSASYERVADVLNAQGKGEQALKKYRMGLEIAEHLLRGASISDASAQRDLAVSYHKIGMLEAARGNEVEARDLLEKGRKIIALLDRIAAHRAQWRADLSKFDTALKTLH